MGYIKRAVSFILAAALIAPAFPPVRAEGGTHVLRRDAFTLGAELSYASQTVVHPSAGREEERTLILPAGHGLTPLAVSGGFVYGNGITVKDAAALLAARGYDVVAGVNGGFFNTSDATPIGLLVENGVLKADEGWVPAIGFTSSGGMIIGKPGLSFSFTARGVTKKIDHLNQVRDRDRLFLYTPEFSETTRTTRQGTHAVLAVNGGGPLRIGGTLDCTVRAVLTGTQAHTIAPDEVVLSATSEEPVSRIANLVPGDAVSISVTCEDLRWLDVTQAVGGRTVLVSDGAINPNLEPGRGPQTCAGLRPDGTAVFLTVDGRQSGYSEGYTLEQTAVRMLELGCVTALELDGGGSTAIGVSYPGKTEFTLVNKPSDGRQRKCSDYIFFVNEKPRTGLPAVLHPYPKDGSLIVRGGTMDFDTYAADINGHAVNTPGDVFFFAPSGAVSAEGGGILFDTPGENTVEAFSPSFGIWGDAAVTVTDTLDTFSVTLQGQTAALTGLALTPGGTAALSASGTKDGFPVAMGGGVVWSYEGEAGILDEQNIFTAAGRSLALGSISAAAGDKSVTLPVRVGTEGLVLEDFEKSVFPLPEPGMGVSAGFARYAQSAARGEKAAETALDFSAPDALSAAPDALYLPLGFALSGAPDFVSFYARGDTGALSLEVTDAAGALHLLPAGTPENAGYGTFTLKLPANAAFVNGLFISRTEGGAETGTLLIDHFVQHWTSSADETAPDIRLLETLEDGDTVTHRVSVTDGGRGISSSRVSVSADGSLHPFSYNETTGILQVTLPAAPLSALSVVSVTAGDSFGNYSRFQIKRDGEAVPRADAAADLDTSWGARTLRYLDDMGLLICAELEGVRYFEPGRVTTRLEIFEMLMLFKGVDTSLYADTVLPFSDLEGLSESQLATAKAAYALGYVSGELQPDGRLLLNANGSLTRATFCVIASAAAPQGLGFVPAQFTDNADIPGYAFNAMSRFAANGLISGIGGGIAAPQQTITRDQVAQILLNLLL